jgi:hypothetical protein
MTASVQIVVLRTVIPGGLVNWIPTFWGDAVLIFRVEASTHYM